MSITMGYCILIAALMIGLSNACERSGPLGMASGLIQDNQITASTVYPEIWDPGCRISNARLYRGNGEAWCAHSKSTSEWLQIDLGVISTVSAILTQGRGDGKEWVTGFKIFYSLDGLVWEEIKTDSGPMIFRGNEDSYAVNHVYFPAAIQARYVNIRVHTWNTHPSMRVELIGCQDSRQPLGVPPYGTLTASSESKEDSACQAADGHLISSKGWCAMRGHETDSWLQLNIGPPSLVTAVITKGRGDTGRKHWVTYYRVSYSNDTKIWTFYQDHHVNLQEDGIYHSVPTRIAADGVVEFGGNIDKDTQRIHYLGKPFIARYIRFHPVTWQWKKAAMRVGVLGKPHISSGDCEAGFVRPNSASPCVENIAYGKDTWLNNDELKDHSKRALYERTSFMKIQAKKAVDGKTDMRDGCTELDSRLDPKPHLTIDLSTKKDVSGVTIYLWDGGETDAGREHALFITSLSVFVTGDDNQEKLCGRKVNHKHLFYRQPIVKIFCGSRLNGRYIRLQAEGVDRDGTKFKTVVCEEYDSMKAKNNRTSISSSDTS